MKRLLLSPESIVKWFLCLSGTGLTFLNADFKVINSQLY